ncbi:unnamed protein product [Bathycoccus prasinos]
MAPKKSKVKKPKVKRSVTQPAKSIIERTICSHPMLKRVQKELLNRIPELDRSRIDDGGSASESRGGVDGGGEFCGISTETSVDALSTLAVSSSTFVKFASAFESLPEITETIASKVSGFCITLTVAATVFKKVLKLPESTALSAALVRIEPEFAIVFETASIDEEETDADELSAPSVLA